MAVGKAQLSVPSTCSTYHVFLSSRGENDSKTFADHLHQALVDAGFHTFRDSDKTQNGEEYIKLELQKTIQQSRMSVILLSEDYASSPWCLDALVMILVQRRNSGHFVLPIFFDVDPSDVRKQTKRIGKDLDGHEKIFGMGNDMQWVEKKKIWREALREVADFGGMVLQNQTNGHEAKFMRRLIKVIADKLRPVVLNVTPHLVGIEERAYDINLWLQDQSTDVGIYVICGVGGIGKTTLAKYVYNEHAKSFEGSSFLANIREVSKEFNGLIQLQKQLLCDILKGKKEKIFNVDEGIMKITDALRCKRIFLVLDDVDEVEQLQATLGMRDWLHPGSKIIITTRNEWLIKPHEADKVHKLEDLDQGQSLELFSWHAFGQDHPFEGYLELAKEVVRLCAGLPLALRVLASSLSGRSPDVWRSAREKLEVIPNAHVTEKLKLSYDSLEDDHDKNLFLHIACFFLGVNKDDTVRILDGCKFYTTVGIQGLIDRSLLMVDDRGKLVMHHLIRDMGREVIRQESEDPGKRSRLWNHKDSFRVLNERTGTHKIKGIILDIHMYIKDQSARTFMTSGSKKYLCETDQNDIYFETDAFAKMSNLKLLILKYVHLARCYEEFPKGLKWLSWRGCPLTSIPCDFPLEGLVAIHIKYSSLRQAWKGMKFLGFLKILNLSHSWELIRTPDFYGLPNLEKLIFKDCMKLIEIDESIGCLQNIILLNLKECKNLRKLPENIGKLKSLEILDISGCLNLERLPPELRMVDSLKVLRADGISLNQILNASNEGKPWHAFTWSWISKPRKNYAALWSCLPNNIVSLSLVNCNLSNNVFPVDFGNLFMLQNLDLSMNSLSSLPECIKGLTKLQTFNVNSCMMLKSLMGLPNSIKELSINSCMSLEKVTYQSGLAKVSRLGYDLECSSLTMIQELFKLEAIENADMRILEHFGLTLESMKDVRVKLDHFTISKNIRLPPQVLHERGIFSTFLPGNKIPIWFAKGDKSALSFTISPHVNTEGLSIAAVYKRLEGPKFKGSYWQVSQCTVHNKTKDLKWVYAPRVFGKPEANDEMTWLSHWKFGGLLEGGDEIIIIVALSSMQVKELGVELVCSEQEEQDEPSKGKIAGYSPVFSKDIIPGDISQRGKEYRLGKSSRQGD